MEIKTLVDSAKAVYPESSIMQQLTVTQALLESGYLRKPEGSLLARKYHNLFGIKAKGTAGYTPELETTEYIKGKPKKVMARFGANLSYSDSFAQHRKILSLSRYRSVWLAKTLPEAAQAVQKSGYATDINYSKLLIGIWDKHVKKYFL